MPEELRTQAPESLIDEGGFYSTLPPIEFSALQAIEQLSDR